MKVDKELNQLIREREKNKQEREKKEIMHKTMLNMKAWQEKTKGGDFMKDLFLTVVKFDFLKGYKTYIGAVLLFVLGGLMGVGVITRDQFESLVAIVSAFTVVSIRKAM